jgi:telomerase reverse transcriptase
MRRACAEADQKSFPDLVAELAGALRHVVFADSVVYAYEKRERLLALLEQHVNENLVKIGPHFYRQRVGIPQGSSLSTILCCFYLAELERTKLAFVRDRGCALLRYVDDTLFVTTSKSRARRFFDVMNEGHPEFGCFIAPEKSLVNFDLPNSRSPGEFVARIHGREFPWCAFVLDPKTLSVRAEFERYSGLCQ